MSKIIMGVLEKVVNNYKILEGITEGITLKRARRVSLSQIIVTTITIAIEVQVVINQEQ